MTLPQWRSVRDELLAANFRLAARGDWAWIYRSPDGARAARLCPYDPAYRLFVSYCRRHAGNAYLPEVIEVVDLAQSGHLVLLPWLETVPPREADELAARLGFAGSARERLGEAHGQRLCDEGARDPALSEIRSILRALLDEGARVLPFFGGIDLNPANVMRTAAGQLKLVDPIFVAGREIILNLRRDPAAVAQRIPPRELDAWLQIACFEHAADDPAYQALRIAVDALKTRSPTAG